tara:strand:+ start:2903 stop:3193 length:291 start_codon:yes stop_codon:yes gene_type:complete
MFNKGIDNELIELTRRIDVLESKLDLIIDKIDTNLAPNTQKMCKHIVFIENVYENVKAPLGFLCNKIRSLIGFDSIYCLESNKHLKRNEEEFELEE